MLEVSSAQAVVCKQTIVQTSAGHNSPPLTSFPPSPLLLIHACVWCEDLHLFSSRAAGPHSWAGGSPCSSTVLAMSWQRQNQAHSIKAHGFGPPGLVRTMLHQHDCCHRGVYHAGAIRAQLHPGSLCISLQVSTRSNSLCVFGIFAWLLIYSWIISCSSVLLGILATSGPEADPLLPQPWVSCPAQAHIGNFQPWKSGGR